VKKILFILCLLFVDTAFATWTYVGSNNVGNVFYEYESVKKDGNLISAFMYVDFKQRQPAGEMSAIYQFQLECGKGSEMLITNIKIYSDNGLKNFIREDSGSEKLDTGSNSLFQTLYKFLCHL